jgi:ABC-type transport system involved in multi-copper enzyme maturation permease subunit
MRILRSALYELSTALSTRRALVLTLIYLALSLLVMNGAITILGKMESHVAEIMQVEKVEGKSGSVSAALWKSKSFRRLVRGVVDDSLVYDDICGRHPAELVYAYVVFLFVPLLTVMLCADRIASDMKTGAVKYMLMRLTRAEWTLGKYLGNALLILIGLMLGAFTAWIVAIFRLGGANFSDLLTAMILWSFKAWFLSLAWLGVALGVSHFLRSPSRACGLSMIMIVVFTIIPALITHFADGPISSKLTILSRLFPSSVDGALWRASFLPVATGAIWLIMLGLLYLSIGYAWFERRDVR